MGGCLTEVELYQAFRREMTPDESQEALHHVVVCPLCHEQWKRFMLDEQVAEGIRFAVKGDARRADEAPGVAAAMELPEHLTIPGFRLRGDFVEGGQARVYRAVHEASQEEVAIKLFYNSALNEGGDARFTRELRSLARLRHPHVIPIRSAGEILGHAYFVMPWIEGMPLDEYVSRYKPALHQRVELIMKICSAVDHAHKRGVLHLDLKPSNVRVDRSGEPIVMDFGLARRATGDPTEITGLLHGIAGTPAYMAPEQVVEGEEVDTRTDVFMLGLLLYEVLGERRAREIPRDDLRRSRSELAKQKPRPIREIAPGIGRELAAIVESATAMGREARYQTAEAMLDDLTAYRRGEIVQAVGGGVLYTAPKFVQRHIAVVLGLVVIGLIVATALVVKREFEQMQRVAEESAAEITQQRIPALEGHLRDKQRRLDETHRELVRVQSELEAASAQAARSRQERLEAERALLEEYQAQVRLHEGIAFDDEVPAVDERLEHLWKAIEHRWRALRAMGRIAALQDQAMLKSAPAPEAPEPRRDSPRAGAQE